MALRLVYHYSDSAINEVTVVNTSLTFKRGYRKKVTVKLNSGSQDEISQPYSFSKETLDITDEPIQEVFEVTI